MRNVGVIGIGDMGSGLAANLLKNGFQVTGIDLKPARMQAFVAMGGSAAATPAAVGKASQAVFVMVMTGDEAKSVILGPEGLVSHMPRGGAVILSATVKPREAREIGEAMAGSGIHLIDTPVSGGYPGAQAGTLTMMAAAPDAVLDRFAPVMEAVSANIHRQFEGTGSHINTMHKDLTISMGLGEELGVPLHTAGSAMQIFHAGRTRYPDGDNWVCTRVIEEIIGAELHRVPKS